MTQKKPLIDLLLDTGCVIALGWILITVIEKVDKLEHEVADLQSADTWEKAELARMHRNQDALAERVFADTMLAEAPPAKKPVGRPRKTTVAKKTTAARKKVAV